MTGWRRQLGIATLVVVGLGGAAAALEWAGQEMPAGPPLTDPGRWAGWLASTDPVVAAFGLVRIAALGTLWYLVAVTTAGVMLRLVGAASLVRLSDRLTIAPVRRMLASSVSLGLAASGVVAVAAPALRGPVSAATQAATPSTTAPPATVTMHLLNPGAPATSPAAPPEPEASTAQENPAQQWTVEPGQSFWSIAEDVLTERWGRSPRDAEIVPYWLRLIGTNEDRLAHADDPDLIFPGQVFEVPAP